MDFKVTEVTAYGKRVLANVEMDELRRTQCLCLNCRTLNEKAGPGCDIARKLFAICVQDNIALAITRCPLWLPKHV